VLNAEFAVVRDGRHLSLVLESAGGKTADAGRSRNDEYVPALRLLLGRLRDRNGVLLSAVVASSRLAGLPETERALLTAPVDLAEVTDLDELRLRITRAQGRVGLPAGAAKEGNNRKRIQLRLAVPGYGPDDGDRLAADLADTVAPTPTNSAALSVDDLLTELRELKLHSNPDGQVSLHKPLALLWMIDHVAAGGTRLVTWPEFRREVGAFLAEFAPAASHVTPQYPFWHLGSTPRLWEVHGVTDVPTSADVTAAAGLTREAAALVRENDVRTKVINFVLSRHLSGARNPDALRKRLAVQNAPNRTPDARDVMRPLVGVEIRTVSGRPNMILGMQGDIVTVRTDRSPAGQPVAISEVQEGLELLTVQGSVRVSVAELGHRSAFVGAVLATLPTAQVADNPATITLTEVDAERVDDEPVFGATDAVAQVKVRREQARLRKLLADDRGIAPCALCGHDYPIEFLVAAHVKRRAVCTDAERHDQHNVAMLACAFGCDTLYETGWITVDATGRIRSAPLAGVPDALGRHLTTLDGRSCPAHHVDSARYFAWHRTTIFRGSESHVGAR
jgi:hypothetical protein